MCSRKERLERLVCAEHCRFFKPWEETHRCEAFHWLADRADSEESILDALERFRGLRRAQPLRYDGLMMRTLCTRCGYYPEECSYRDRARTRYARPCGGVVAIDVLLDHQLIDEQTLFGNGRRAPRI
jgi:hypothetical protein